LYKLFVAGKINMILWINGAFGAGKTTTAFELNRRLPDSFVYDPENVGYFIRRNTNGLFSKGDFQNIPLWREMNYKILSMITEKYNGTVIVPMTLVNPDYYSEIVERLISDGIEVKHYILYAERGEIRRRLKKRAFPFQFIRKDSFALNAVDRCVDSFYNNIKEIKIHTGNMSVDNVVAQIAELSNLQLSPDKKTPLGKLGKFIYRTKIMLKHIR
jgi:deoxyadenosine/deoxycytidine kinase